MRVPTLWGWMIIAAFFSGAVLSCAPRACDFLSVSARLKAPILVVEGWIPDYALRQAAGEYKEHGYSKLIVTGGEMDLGFFLTEFTNMAEIGGATLKKFGLDEKKIFIVPAQPAKTDRTYAAGKALAGWLRDHAITAGTVNVYTLGPHARRTRLLFEKALGSRFTVGVISCEDRSYDRESWWKTSNGFKTVITEGLAYFYARLFFTPPEENPPSPPDVSSR